MQNFIRGQLLFVCLFSPRPPTFFSNLRYWSHVVNCSSCSAAYKGLNIVEPVLKIISVILIGVAVVTQQGALTTFQRSALFVAALICFER
ncbi:hypothetical protein SOVF_206400 [Spinacia oleracea]|nr:hypothetical protein SOVF_206400 [Spinacia oleracea]